MPFFRGPWPVTFEISFEKMSKNLRSKAEKGMPAMDWGSRHELLSILAEDVQQYTMNPDMKQRLQVAETLIKRFPNLKSNVGTGLDGWAQRLYDKMKDVRVKLGTPECKAKRKSAWEEPAVKIPHRGEVNWAPFTTDLPVAMDSTEDFLEKEATKPESERDREKIALALKKTFQHRRSVINKKPPSMINLLNSYPLLFTIDGLILEFKLLQNINPITIIEELQKYTQRIIELARDKIFANSGNKNDSQLQKKRQRINDMKSLILAGYDISSQKVYDMLIAAFLLLPVNLNENPDYVYRVKDKDTLFSDVPKDTSGPVLVFLGDPISTNDVYICAEETVLITLKERVQIIWTLFAIYYVCNTPYPAEAPCTFLFLQTFLLKFHHERKMPVKLLNFIEKL